MKYVRALVHFVYATIAIVVAALADPAVRSFVENHFGGAAMIPVIVALLRIIEAKRTGS